MRFASWILLLLGAPVVAEEEAPNLARTDPPAARVSLSEALEKGVAFLVAHQNKNGSFGGPTSGRNYEIMASVPGSHHAFRSATTSLAYMGLLGADVKVEGRDAALERALRWLVAHARVRRARPSELYNTWALSYGIRSLSMALNQKAKGAKPEAIRAAAQEMVDVLHKYQSTEGGWGYYDFSTRAYKPSWSTSFSTATALIAFDEAARAGLKIPEGMLQKGVKLVERCRTREGSYLYGYYLRYGPHRGINRHQGSSMRTPGCDLALLLHEKLKPKDLVRGMREFIRTHRFAVAGLRRPIPHESWFQVSGYFYLFGHSYAADTLPHFEPELRKEYARAIAKGVLKARQKDGSFWDYPLYRYHKGYGTGYALMALGKCAQVLEGEDKK